MKKWVITIILVGLGAYFLGGTVQYKDDLYQGKTAQEWAKKANDNQLKVDVESKLYEMELKQSGACQVDPHSTACNPLNEVFDASQPTPTQATTNLDANLPYWCKRVISAWMSHGYSRATTNQLMKKDNPECTY